MCLAVPGKVVESDGDRAVVTFQGSRVPVSVVLTPEAGVGDWVLVHAGFAISTINEKDAVETWDYLRRLPVADGEEPGAAETGVA